MLAILRMAFLLCLTTVCVQAYGKDCSSETGTGEVPPLPVNPTKEQVLLNAKALATCQINGFTDTFNNLTNGNAAEQEAARQELILNYTSATPPESGYYSAGVAIEQQAAEISPTTDVGRDIYSAQISRPVLTINPDTDPLFKNFEEISTLSTSLVDSNYQGCVDLPVGTEDVTTHEQRTCHVAGRQDPVNYSCQRDLSVTCNGSIKNNFSTSDFSISGSTKMPTISSVSTANWKADVRHDDGGCHTYTNEIKFNLTNPGEVSVFSLVDLNYDDQLQVYVNNTKVFEGRWSTQPNKSGSYDCVEYGNYAFDATDRDIKNYLVSGSNTIKVVNRIGGGGGFKLQWNATKNDTCNTVDTIATTCPTGENTNGTFLGSSCISGEETRSVMGYPVTRSCWAWSDEYTRLSSPVYTPEPACSLIEQDGCGQVGSECIANNGAICTDQLITYDCASTTSADHVSLCGEAAAACPDGNCTEEYQTWSDSTDPFLHANVAMESVAEVVKAGVDSMNPGGTFLIFTGNGMNCDKGDLGTFDCCQDSGWANGLGLVNCSSQEQALGLAKEAGQTHYVGEFCASELCVLGVCTCVKHSKSYCVYPSKLSRMIMEQANQQLGRNYGAPENPVCDGLSLTQFESIDMGTMDFSEFNNDIMDQFNAAGVPASSQMMQQIEDQISDMTGN